MNILSTALAQDIVTRTMRIIPYNVNVMDAHGSIIASGNPARIGELHAGALLALAKKLTMEIDAASARNLHGAQPGINLPLTVHGQLCGAVGLSGAPDEVRHFGELVRLTAEMILEQAQLAGELQRDSRYREAFVLNLINGEHANAADLAAWAHRLDISFEQPHAAYLLELDDNGIDLQSLQLRLQARLPSVLTAAAGPHELAILDLQDKQPSMLATVLRELCPQPHALTMGIALQGIAGVATSYQSARTAARIGRSRDASRTGQRLYSYYDHTLPVLLSGLNTGWQAAQLRAPIEKLGKNKDMLQRTLEVWFAHDGHPAATAEALHIHRNTLDYRLRRIGEITGLDLARLEDRFLLYISVLLSSP
ncbi:helix-turn-helix domain-containing protein [Duganella sp. sic0402]|uniref:sugar diacid recognition domain-containing protein n=1 Tax=Duganella sp. sic0402 TaxID=2854786 RepID=UPI001C459E0C|nr:sugar diacid recognition domain-containing protein [Duganella sp. sic0402]MBV7534874.1 helix-turn-helix domain-containing protein [Duganella sp. sic0402]